MIALVIGGPATDDPPGRRRGTGVRVALFASGGEIPARALRALRDATSVVAVIRPRPPLALSGTLRRATRWLVRGRGAPDDLSMLAADLGVPEWEMAGAADPSVPCRMRAERIDFACVATFPWRLPPAVLDTPRFGVVNVHASLLPRHRGPNPWFWTYHSDDREAGVSVHRCEARVDAGPILAQSRWPLPRGHPVARLHDEVAAGGATLLPAVLARAEDLSTFARPQDEATATRAPRVPPRTRMLDSQWGSERTWHFLAGLVGQYREPLHAAGRPLLYARVPEFELTAPRATPGSIDRDGASRAWRLWCHDGFVRLMESGA